MDKEKLITKLLQDKIWALNDAAQMLAYESKENGGLNKIKRNINEAIEKSFLTMIDQTISKNKVYVSPKNFLLWADSQDFILPYNLLEHYFSDFPDFDVWLAMSTWHYNEAAALLCLLDPKMLGQGGRIEKIPIKIRSRFPCIGKILQNAAYAGDLYKYDDIYEGVSAFVSPDASYSVLTYLKFWEEKLQKLIPLPQPLLEALEEYNQKESAGAGNGQQNINNDKPKIHGNAERFAQNREQVLGAALSVLKKYPEQCSTAADILRLVEEKSPLFWRETSEIPLSHDKASRLINQWLKKLE